MQHPAMHRFLALPHPYTQADAEVFVTVSATTAGPEAGRAVVETATGDVVGSAVARISGSGPYAPTIDLGYAIYPHAQGRGFAREAVELITSWAFGQGAARAEIGCTVDNLASARTALNAGFHFEGILRGAVALRSDVLDTAMFARLPSDPRGPVPHSFVALPPDGLTDGVVRLRALHPSDAGELFEEWADPLTVANGFTGMAPTFAAASAAAVRGGLDWLVGAAAPFAVVDVDSGRLAGTLRLRHAGPPGVGGIGYSVHPAFRGRGVTARALRLLVPWAFDVGFARLELGAKSDNVASQRAALSAGFEPDGVRGARLRYPDGSYADEVRFVLINPRVARR
jgi:RimJ/RimL family protein N-acetyltransferase